MLDRGQFDELDRAPEKASLDTELSSSNKGYKLLEKMGWKEQTGLGKHEQGRVDPIRPDINEGSMGLGKDSQYTELALDATKERVALAIEKELTAEDIKAAMIAQIHEEMSQEIRRETKSDFYCETCDKQYKNVLEMENHLSSYDHHHKKRLADLKRAEYSRGEEDRRKRQKKLEDKEAKRIQALAAEKAAAVTTGAPPLPASPPPPAPPPPPPDTGAPISFGFSLSSSTKKRKL